MKRLLDIVKWSALDRGQRKALLRRPATQSPGLPETVAGIIRSVREGGDATLRELTLKFDGVDLESLEVDSATLKAACETVDAELSAAIADASDRIRRFHAIDLPVERSLDTATGLTCTVTYRPLVCVGIYVPGGTAPLVSTVMMLAIPARLAGCREIIMCSPPGRNGEVATEVLAAAEACGVDRVFPIGGAQAIAAMAYGTESVPRCNKIFGPGNAWVTEAKQQVSRDPEGAAIDLPAGPSELMVIADEQAGQAGGVDFIAWDLLSQAEHGTDSQVLLVTDSEALAAAVALRVQELAATSSREAILRESLGAARFIVVSDLAQALAIANEYAPEHLILNTRNARELADGVDHAGSVFLGPWTPESLGDYCSGTNHVLPTYGYARAYGALGVGDFMRRMTLQEASATGLVKVGRTVEVLAAVEGLEAHRMAVSSRLAALKRAPAERENRA